MIGFPLLLIPLTIYFMIALLLGLGWSDPVYSVPAPLGSGVRWTATFGDAFLIFTLLMLMFEFIKSTRHGKSLVEHFLSLCLAGGAAALFWMVPQAGNSTFLLFTVICFVDLFAGFAASLRRARRAVAVAEPVPVAVEPAPARPEPVRVEPTRVEPVRVEPVRAEPALAEPARVEPRGDAVWVQPTPADPEPGSSNPFTTAPPMPRVEPVQKS